MGIYEIRKWRKLLIFLLAVALFSLLALVWSEKQEEDASSRLILVTETSTAVESVSEATRKEAQVEAVTSEVKISQTSPLIPVYVSGAVKHPSLCYLAEDALWQDAVLAAGGLREDAASAYINLAAPIAAHQMIYIPSLEEWKNGQPQVIPYPATVYATTDGKNQSTDQKIYLSKASAEELSKIPGVGEKTAAAIIQYREENGAFSSIEDVMKIPGIKEGKFSQMKDFILP